ncbi:MAG: YhbY family RNA-binding protein [Clostridia bacterium]|nr:YhbY family RNA-binding protein [Clostridia bacterium]
MLTSKQRAFLRSLGAKEEAILMVGKGGMSPELEKSADEALAKRELIKGKVLESSPIDVHAAASQLSDATESELVAVTGRTFVLYRRNEEEPKIVLPKAKQKG